jgi:hypothetical protein
VTFADDGVGPVGIWGIDPAKPGVNRAEVRTHLGNQVLGVAGHPGGVLLLDFTACDADPLFAVRVVGTNAPVKLVLLDLGGNPISSAERHVPATGGAGSTLVEWEDGEEISTLLVYFKGQGAIDDVSFFCPSPVPLPPPVTPPGVPTTKPCDGGIVELELTWLGSGPADVEVVDKKGNRLPTLPAVLDGLAPGDSFVVLHDPAIKKDKLPTDIFVVARQGGVLTESTKIHVSCSKPIGPGFVFGSFLVVDFVDRGSLEALEKQQKELEKQQKEEQKQKEKEEKEKAKQEKKKAKQKKDKKGKKHGK